MSQAKTVKIRVNATFHRLQINKNIKFQTKIQWKRHENKTETRLVNHQHGFSIFQQSIFLDFNLVYNEGKGIYQDKNTQIVAVIMYEGKIKSGGYAKYNIAQVINNYLDGKVVKVPLTQCPDSNANIEVTFTYESLDEEGDTPSFMNVSSRDLNMSRIDFHDDKMSLQMDRINATISKLAELAQNVKTKEKSSSEKIPSLVKKIQELEGQRSVFIENIEKLESKFEQKQKEFSQKSKKDQKVIADLQKQLQKKAKDNKSKEIQQFSQEKKMREQLASKEKECERHKAMYEQVKQQLQQMKSKDIRTSLGFEKMEVEDVHQFAKFQVKEQFVENKKQMQKLRQENGDLQIKVATESFRIAQLFNAAYEIGGGKLLDELQKAIGLIQS